MAKRRRCAQDVQDKEVIARSVHRFPRQQQPHPVPSKRPHRIVRLDGHAFDGSSIAWMEGIQAVRHAAMPDPATAYIDPFMDETTLNITCDVVEPSDGKGAMSAIRARSRSAPRLT